MDEVKRGNYDIFFRVNNNFIDFLGKRDEWGLIIASNVTPRSGSSLLRHTAWQYTGDKRFLEKYYAELIQTASQCMDMYTEGHWWVDRVSLDTTTLQRSRLGGIALWRGSLYPGHAVSWRFEPPATGENVAILIPDATTTSMTVIAYNLDKKPVTAVMTGWDIEPGTWEIVEDLDTNGDEKPDTVMRKQSAPFERTGQLSLSFPPGQTATVSLKRISSSRPYWKRPDLGIGKDDIVLDGSAVRVKVHSLGSVDVKETTVALVDTNGSIIAAAPAPAIKAPLDFIPKTASVTISVPNGIDAKKLKVVIDPGNEILEITERNNSVNIEQ